MVEEEEQSLQNHVTFNISKIATLHVAKLPIPTQSKDNS